VFIVNGGWLSGLELNEALEKCPRKKERLESESQEGF